MQEAPPTTMIITTTTTSSTFNIVFSIPKKTRKQAQRQGVQRPAERSLQAAADNFDKQYASLTKPRSKSQGKKSHTQSRKSRTKGV
jgi:hypothetical protein